MRWFFSNLAPADYLVLGIVAVFAFWMLVGFFETMLWGATLIARLLAALAS